MDGFPANMPVSVPLLCFIGTCIGPMYLSTSADRKLANDISVVQILDTLPTSIGQCGCSKRTNIGITILIKISVNPKHYRSDIDPLETV